MSRTCPICDTVITDGVALCPACTLGKIFGFDDRPQKEILIDGKFRLGKKLGEGGFGLVYRATQIEPIQREVAIKIIKGDMDSREVITRFEAERQALALLDHPGIAKLYEAGTTHEGRPFFAMELVEGQAITDHCRNLSQIECLTLFTQVCEAIHHAHQRGIIHRDLKPSNILVASDGSLKIIDFGIAKATTRLLTEKTLLTEFHQFIGTPAYVSPEQAAMSGRPVDTRSDLYSLGVLLYELLAGRPPFETGRFTKAGLEEILRIIREEEPDKPSTHLAKKIERDLDRIVMRALEKDPDRRYSSAYEFSRDIHRYLDHEPVEASPPSALYRLQKFTHRNRTAVIAASIALLGLIGGLGLASYGLIQANEQAKEARTQANRANTIVHLLDEMFSSADPFITGGPDYTLRELLDDYGKEFEGKLDDQPEVELSIQRTIASAYEGLGDYRSAEQHFRRAHQLSIQLAHPDEVILKNKIAWSLRHQSHYQEALAEATSPILRVEIFRLLGQSQESLALAKTIQPQTEQDHTILALTYAQTKDLEMAKHFAKQALHFAEKKYGINSPRLIRPLDTLATISGEKREYLSRAKEIAKSTLPVDHPARLFAETRAAESSPIETRKTLTTILLEKIGGNPETFTPVLKLIASLASEGKFSEARTFLTEKLGINYADFSSGEPVTMEVTGTIVQKIMQEGRVKNYLPLVEQALSVARIILSEDHPHTIELKRLLAYIYRWDHRYADSEKLSREALAQCQKNFGEDHGITIDCLYHLVETLRDQNRKLKITNPRTLEELGERYLRNGDLLTAQNHLDEALVINRRLHGNSHPATFRTLTLLGELEVAHQWIRLTARGPLLIEAYELSKKLHGDDAPETARCLTLLASDNAQILGPRETLKLCQKSQASAFQRLFEKRSATDESNRQQARTYLQRFTRTKDPQLLVKAAFHESRAGRFQESQNHLDQAQPLLADDPERIAAYDNIASWQAWRTGRPKLASEMAFASFHKHFSDPDFLPSAPSRAHLLRTAFRASWDQGDCSQFWKHFDTKIGTILIPRESLWSHSSEIFPKWNEPNFPQRLLWARSHSPFSDFRIAANSRLSKHQGPHYFRTDFEVENPAGFQKLKLRLTRWAGAIVYLNGKEIVRNNIDPVIPEPGGQMNPRVFEFSRDHLLEGANTLAIEVHRYTPAAALYFECQLEGLTE